MSATPPKISVALCTYNGERHLAQQLDSLLGQDAGPIELVACDDASSDGTWRILQEYAPRFGSCTLLRNNRTLGVRANFEQAFRACKGEWIAPCDQDDLWEPRKLGRLLADAGDAMLVYSDSALIDADGHPLGARVSERIRMISGSAPLAFAFGNCVSGHASMFRRHLLDHALPLPEGLFYDEWLAFVASCIGTIRYVDEALVRFRQHAGNLTRFAGQGDAGRRSPLALHRIQAPKLDALANWPGPTQAPLQKLARLWHARESEWLSPRLAWLMLREHGTLMALEMGSRRPAWRHAMKLLWGLRAKMMVWHWRHGVDSAERPA